MDSLSLLTFLPLLTAAVVLLIPGYLKGLVRCVSFLGGLITLILAIGMYSAYERGPEDTSQRPGSAATVLAAEQERMLLGANLGPAYANEGGIARWRAKYLPQPGALLSSADASAFEAQIGAEASPEAVRVWKTCLELSYGLQVPATAHMAFVEFSSWIPAINVNYFIGVDGLSMPLILLTAILFFLCFAYSWTIERAPKGFYVLFLLLETGLIGVFVALDFFLFYVFWEIVLLPMYFLIGIWGGENRLYAAIKFFIYTLVGSVVMLVVMIVLYFNTEPSTFNVLALMRLAPELDASKWGMQWWLFLGLFLGFAIKVPIFPFHTWLPDAHVQAPTSVSVILAGILLKMGGYGFLRFSYTMLPDAATSTFFITLLAVLGMINIVYGAFCALAQKDFKKLVAYSSVSHMGYCLLGLAALSYYGVSGAVLQMLNHGVSSAMMFLLVGVIYDRAHHRDLTRFGGIGLQMPFYTGLATVGFFASLGLPGLNGFISEFMCFQGAYDTNMSLITAERIPDQLQGGIGSTWIVYASLLGIVLTAAYILWTIQRVYLGNVTNEEYKRFPDLTFREVFALAPLAALCVILGVYPKIIIDYMDPTLQTLTDMVRAALPN
jgi:NADH-quinone oxidoreductase subunit M